MIDDDVSNSYTATPISSTKASISYKTETPVVEQQPRLEESNETISSAFGQRVDLFFASIFFADSQHPKPWFLSFFNLYAVVKSFIDRTLTKYNAYENAINRFQSLVEYVNGKMGINISIEQEKFASKLSEYATIADDRVSTVLMQIDDEFDFFRTVLKSSASAFFQFIAKHVGSSLSTAWTFVMGLSSFLIGFIFSKLEQLLEVARLFLSNMQQRFPETYDRVENVSVDAIGMPAQLLHGVMTRLGSIRSSSTASIHSSYDSARVRIDDGIFKLVIYSLRSLKSVSLSIYHRFEPSIALAQPHVNRVVAIASPIVQNSLRWFEAQKENSYVGPYVTKLSAIIQTVASNADVLWTAIDQAAKDEDEDSNDE